MGLGAHRLQQVLGYQRPHLVGSHQEHLVLRRPGGHVETGLVQGEGVEGIAEQLRAAQGQAPRRLEGDAVATGKHGDTPEGGRHHLAAARGPDKPGILVAHQGLLVGDVDQLAGRVKQQRTDSQRPGPPAQADIDTDIAAVARGAPGNRLQKRPLQVQGDLPGVAGIIVPGDMIAEFRQHHQLGSLPRRLVYHPQAGGKVILHIRTGGKLQGRHCRHRAILLATKSHNVIVLYHYRQLLCSAGSHPQTGQYLRRQRRAKSGPVLLTLIK